MDEDAEVPEGSQVWLQTVDSYRVLTGVDMEAGKAFKLTCEYTADAESNRALRILSNDTGAQVPFYVGDILITAIPDAQDETEIYHESFKNGTGMPYNPATRFDPWTDAFFDGNTTATPLCGNVHWGWR